MGLKASFVVTCLVTMGFNFQPPNAMAAMDVSKIVRQATSANQSESQVAIAALRSQGYTGIQAFWNTYAHQLPNNPQLRKALDAICKQKDCDTSRLYWYTDLEQAKAAAKLDSKPILSLRLLGNLDEELSCANSRFFRTVLYPNAEVSQLLRDRFILHWQSERPVPKVTIDFGDGRKLERTLTGNSIHYILDAEGRPVDALPGLYSANAFTQNLLAAEQPAKLVAGMTGQARANFLRKYHSDRLANLQSNWDKDLAKLGMPSQPLVESVNPRNLDSSPRAEVAGELAVGKSVVELPILLRTSVIPPNAVPNSLPTTKLDDATWERLGELHAESARLDRHSLSLMQRQLDDRKSLTITVANFERAIAQDTIRNEYLFHAQIHNWFINRAQTNNLQTLNQRVYTQLFLTPASDPWLGLLPSNVYTGISVK